MCRATSPARRDERGLSSSVLASILFPLVLSVLWLAMQWAMLSWAHATAQAAAQDAARAAAALDATDAHGHAAAEAAADNGSLETHAVSVQRGAITTTATVTGTAHRLIPGFPVAVEVTATAPTQRLTSS
ncbi:TadE/TadG family type IV pilus assembly protein [Tessaracoccus sp. MC1756]|uniref:TadE/TadG family type IV pilus assembly protein n=1 Tax=Tessaracoccus sp. MC1756 TaxID=2760311 RepID=UPI0016015B02|nr:TadE/TadG family type IV pilus assembly protein [Tessaracoccus sp. MC1756]MBB1510967.1 pilus assembly protein [Tessaracoccus sp. MC1756]